MTNSEPEAPPSSAERDARPQPPRRNGSTTEMPQKKSTATPKLSFAFCAVCLICWIGLILVIYLSNGRSVGTWIPHVPAIQPSVLISILVTLFNTFEFFIIADGLTVVWWRAFHNDATLQALHYIKWNGLKEMWRALRKCPETRQVFAVLMIASIIRIYDAPLLQRSIKPVLSNQVVEYDDIWKLPDSITEGGVGTVDSTAPARLFASFELDRSLKEWYTNTTIRTVSGCEGSCTGPISGAGVEVKCSSNNHILDLDQDPFDVPQPLFQIAFNRTTENSALYNSSLPVLNMRLLYATDTDSECRATMATQLCAIRPATVMYSAIRQERSITLDHAQYPQIVATQLGPTNASSADDNPANALAALEYFGHYFLQSNGTVTQPSIPGGGYSWEPSGVLPRQYANFPINDNPCAFRWDNATDDLIWALHDVMFRIAYASASGNETGPALTWTYTRNELEYNAEYVTLWVAIGSMLFSLFASMSLLWGFWRLDREVSLSPVETARALAEAVTQRPSGNRDMTIDELLEVFGKRMAKRPITAEEV